MRAVDEDREEWLWPPKRRWLRWLPPIFALLVSIGLHTVLPFARFSLPQLAKSREPVEVTLTQLAPDAPSVIPLPPDDDVADEPPAPDDAPPKPDQPAKPETAAPSAAVKTPPKPPAEPAEPPPQPMAPPEPTADENAAAIADAEAARAEALADRAARLDERRADLRAEVERRRAARLAREESRNAPAGGGGAPQGVAEKGTPDDVYICEKDGLGERITVNSERPVTQWIHVVPTVFFGFDTKPGMNDYLGRMQQVVSRVGRRKRGLGPVEFTVPREVLQMPLEEPRGARLALGRTEGKCLIGMRYTPQFFPLTLMHVPARLIDAKGRSTATVIDLTLGRNATFEITSTDGTPLPFSRGRLKNSRQIERNIEDHYQAARLFMGIAELFGFKQKRPLPKPAKPAPR